MLKPVCGALALALSMAAFAAPDAFKHPLDIPAAAVKRQLLSTQMNAVTRAGDRLVAVGIRGLVLVSDDGGQQWTQVAVPVAIDLLDVHFPTAKSGWAVGHGGVVLHTRDGGNTWIRQLDGRATRKMLTAHFQARVDSGDAQAQRHLQDTEINYETGPEQALLSVWFMDERNGFVCGSFGTVLATHDGGATWESWIEKVEADKAFHLNAVRGTRQGVLMASESGIVFRLDADKQRFVPMPTGYNGTFFAIQETDDAVLAMGLRGTVYRMKGDNAKWEKVDTGVAGTITAAAPLAGGGLLLATLAGQVVATRDGEHFRTIPVANPMSYAGVVAAGPDKAVLVGRSGVRTIPLKF